MGGLWAEVMGGVQAEAMGCCLNWGGVLAAVMRVQTGPSHSGEQLLCFFGREWDTSGGVCQFGDNSPHGWPLRTSAP